MPRDLTDRRVRRTRARLAMAAQAMLEEGRWHSASVQDLADRADLARSSVYAHFTGKAAVLHLLVDRALTGAEEEMGGLVRREGRLLTLAWLSWHVRSLRPLYREVLGLRGPADLRRKLALRVESLLAIELRRSGQEPAPETVRFVVAGLLAVLEDWVAKKDAALTGDLEERLSTMVRPLLPVPVAA
ncbi:TetR/AcrR family transcriptional regulator [Histidinibacterium aquaticum]|uniref:Helix-turn-helix transcriptional regulator n=1 Tax=Histidinibacterium aquaticum TaxID=2613962 RepID=A0A5J5GCQ6_9RHOB|nr:TetR/AcrR family transcriptional regulator [Histidinibacterium aquaticum]KAA9005693.1 helix-turn-helix transcriptional regulator [Histidinibacterium aquaticum]